MNRRFAWWTRLISSSVAGRKNGTKFLVEILIDVMGAKGTATLTTRYKAVLLKCACG